MRPSPIPPARRPAPPRTDRLLRHCVYMIATGKWAAGERLPSIRATRRAWGANQATVQQAYGRLQGMGLAESRPRSGWFVAGGGRVDRLSLHRYELENIHRRTADTIRERTGLSTLGVLRYLAELEEIRRREAPEIAFVECTAQQARAHAGEITSRLRVPILPLTTGALEGKRSRVPHYVRTLLTSPFHLDEIRRLFGSRAGSGPRVAAVPIEVSPEIASGIARRHGRIVLLESEDSMARHIAADASRLLGGARFEVRLLSDPSPAMKQLLGKPRGGKPPTVLLSPRLWGALTPEWREHPRVLQISFRVTEAAWPLVADAIGLPVGL